MTHEERERSLQAIGDVIEHWLTWVQRECDAEGLETTADTHIMFGYEGAPPCWPSVGQLKRWLEVFRATPAVAPEGQVTEAGLHKLIEAARIYEASCRLGGKEQEFASRKLDEAKAALTTVAPADDDAELRALAADLCRAMRVDVGQITLHWAETFLREHLASGKGC